MSAVLLSIASVVAVSLVSLIGVFTISVDPERLRSIASLFVSFAVGALLGDAFLHLLPEVFSRTADPRTALLPPLWVLAGVLFFFVIEKLLRHQHHRVHPEARAGGPLRVELVAINVLGDAVHNFIDGLLIGASYLTSPALGISTSVAVFLHEIPQELGDYGILIHSGLSARQAILLNLSCASTALAGTLLALLAGNMAGGGIVRTLVPLTAGGFIYLAAADLIPELQHDHSLRGLFTQTALISLGVALMALLTLAE